MLHFYCVTLLLRKSVAWVVRDEILHCVQNDMVGLDRDNSTAYGCLLL